MDSNMLKLNSGYKKMLKIPCKRMWVLTGIRKMGKKRSGNIQKLEVWSINMMSEVHDWWINMLSLESN